MKVNEFLREFVILEPVSGHDEQIQCLRPYVVCADGFGVSIQASWGHYCVPRIDTNSVPYGRYEKVELGFPTAEVPEWLDYAEDPEEATGTVYGYVPVDLVDTGLEKHGGIDLAKTKERYVKTMTQAGRSKEHQYETTIKIFERLGA